MHQFYEVNLLNSQVHCARCVFDNVSKKICPLQMLCFLHHFLNCPFVGKSFAVSCCCLQKKYKQIFTISVPLDSYKYLEYHLTVFRILLENYKYLIYIIKRLFFLVKVFP